MSTMGTATGMKVQAVVEGGLLISEEAAVTATWDNSVNESNTGSYALVPASTNDGTNWYHNKSNDANVSTGAGYVATYETLVPKAGTTQTASSTGKIAATNVYYHDADNDGTKDSGERDSFVKYTMYLKTSGNEALALSSTTSGKQYLNIDAITISNMEATEVLDCSLRIGIKVEGDSTFYIFAPVGAEVSSVEINPTASYNVNGSTATTIKNSSFLRASGSLATDIPVAGLTSLPAVDTDSPVQVDIFVWFEGEDANCKSANAEAELKALGISVVFSLETKT